MPNAGDSFSVILKEAHLRWGTHRYTNSRDRINGESYIQIPVREAKRLDIKRGEIFECKSVDGLFCHPLKASGCAKKGSLLPKQFHSCNGLKILGNWYRDIGAKIGDTIRITWVSKKNIMIEKI